VSGEWAPEGRDDCGVTVCAIGQFVGRDLPYRAVGTGGMTPVRVRGLPCVTSAFAVLFCLAVCHWFI